jgi:hypothetical protein
MLRISTTQLETFRLWSDPEQDWMSEEDLIASIRGTSKLGYPAQLGTAFDAVIGSPAQYRVQRGYRYTDRSTGLVFDFGDDVMDPCLAVFDPRGVWQVKAEKRYGECVIVAKADHIVGGTVEENKAILSTFDYDKYAASCQWRFYLDIFGAIEARYHVFCLSEAANRVISLKSIETFSLYPYVELPTDCRELLDRFLHFVRLRGLEGVLEARQTQAEQASDFSTTRVLSARG